MSSFFNHCAIFHYKDRIDTADGLQSVRNYYGRHSQSFTKQTIQGFLDSGLRFLLSRVVSINVASQAQLVKCMNKLTHANGIPGSNADVASSSRRSEGFLTKALAIAIRCFCPLKGIPHLWEQSTSYNRSGK